MEIVLGPNTECEDARNTGSSDCSIFLLLASKFSAILQNSDNYDF